VVIELTWLAWPWSDHPYRLTRLVAPLIAGYTKVTVLTIPVQYTAGRNNRKGGAVRSFLRATSGFLPDTSLSGDSENGIPR
jgi:hypothetical protein